MLKRLCQRGIFEKQFATVLRLSFYGTVGCGVILVCALINYARAPRWISMTLWGLVALRLIIPFQFSSAVSLFQFRNLSDLSNQVGQGDYRTALEGSVKTAGSRRHRRLMRPFSASVRAYGLLVWRCCESGHLCPTLWAVTFDGRSILLVLYEDGPSGDPYTHFYRYQNNQIIEAGGIADDIRLCGISPEGIITSAIRQDVVQTDWITVRWQFNNNRILLCHMPMASRFYCFFRTAFALNTHI